MHPHEFAERWSRSIRTERAAAQEHFIDLCRMLGFPIPNEADPTGDWYAFEKGAEKFDGSNGFADVWKRGHFAWEYKGKRRDLRAAYQQLLQYHGALENPPLLVVCDLERFEIYTKFTNTSSTQPHRFSLADLASDPAEPLRILRAVLDAYSWPHDLSDEELLARLLAVNLQWGRGRGRTGLRSRPTSQRADDSREHTSRSLARMESPAFHPRGHGDYLK